MPRMPHIITPKEFTRRDLLRLASITIGCGALSKAADAAVLGARGVAMGGGGNSEDWKPFVIFNYKGGSNKSVYFDTGVIPSADTRFDFSIKGPQNPAKTVGWQTGCRAGWIRNAFLFNMSPKSGSAGQCTPWFIRNASVWYRQYDETHTWWEWDANPHVFSIRNANQGQAYIDGVLKSTQGQTFSGSSNSIYIGDVNENGTAKGGTDSQGSMMLFYAELYEGETLTHRYVPCMKDGDVYLHDEVTNAYLTHRGNAVIAYGKYQNGVEHIIYPDPTPPTPTSGDVYYGGTYGEGPYETSTVIGKVTSGSISGGSLTIDFNGASEIGGYSGSVTFEVDEEYGEWYCSDGSFSGFDDNGFGNWYSFGEGEYDIYIQVRQ